MVAIKTTTTKQTSPAWQKKDNGRETGKAMTKEQAAETADVTASEGETEKDDNYQQCCEYNVTDSTCLLYTSPSPRDS